MRYGFLTLEWIFHHCVFKCDAGRDKGALTDESWEKNKNQQDHLNSAKATEVAALKQ